MIFTHQILDQNGILSVRTIKAREAGWTGFPAAVPRAVVDGLAKAGITKLYLHQAEAIEHILDTRNTVVTTSTSSGKSLIYTVPVFSTFIDSPIARALYLTPSKALGQNQLKTIQTLAGLIPWSAGEPVVEVCDGDTPSGVRRQILQRANLIITTPDMLHCALLPQHNIFSRLFSHLRYVIIDEAHTYRGVFGNHVCHVLRRLRRLCRRWGSDPTFVLTTATVGNPARFAKNLAGVDFTVISADSSPAGKKEVVFYAPPEYTDRDGNARRRLTHFEATRALATCVEQGHRVIAFGRSRRTVESMYRKIQEDYPHLAGAVTSYKGTYTPEVRRLLEQSLFNKTLKGVICTNALELGIDIGDLDVCILAGFPGSISSTWQQSGRAGRKGQNAMIVLMAGEDPLELFLVRNPDYFFQQPVEKAVVDPRKMQFLTQHLLLASREMPLSKEDEAFWDEGAYIPAINFLRQTHSIELLAGPVKTYGAAVQFSRFGLRGDRDNYRVVTGDGKTLEEYDYPAVLLEVYPGAIISVLGGSYEVENIDFDRKVVLARPLSRKLSRCRTYPLLLTSLDNVRADRSNAEVRVKAVAGTLTVTTHLQSYSLISPTGLTTPRVLSQEMPPHRLNTTGLWLEIKGERYETMHAMEHLLRVIIPWLVMCERGDMGSYVDERRGAIFVYDSYEGGVGLAESALDIIEDCLERAYRMLAECDCADGCPSCIHIPQCQTRNERLDKKGAAAFLSKILDHPVPKHLQSPQSTDTDPLIKNMADLRPAARDFELKRRKSQCGRV